MLLRSKGRDKPSTTSNERKREKEGKRRRGYSAKYEEGGSVGEVNYFLTHPKKEKKKEEVEQG